MIPELYRPFETHTLMDLVSYGDCDDEEPRTEEWPIGEEEAAPRQRVFGHRRRAWSLLRAKKRKWLRLGRRLIAGPRLP
jgi:hypothetical protein